MARLRPGWLVALAAAGLSVSAWLPWLTSPAAAAGFAAGAPVGSVGIRIDAQ